MIIVDTGFWVALLNDKDRYHQSEQETLAKYNYEPLITTWCVLTETSHLLLQRSANTYQGVQKQLRLMSLFQKYPQRFQLFDLQKTHLNRINFLIEKYQNLPTVAVCLVMVDVTQQIPVITYWVMVADIAQQIPVTVLG